MSLSDPFIVVYQKSGSEDWKEVGRTEVVVNNLKYVNLSSLILFYIQSRICEEDCAAVQV